MPTAFKLITAVLAGAASFGLIITGELGLFMLLAGPGFIAGYYRFLRSRPPAPSWVINLASVLTLVFFCADWLLFSRDLLIAVADLTIIFQVIRSFDLRDPWAHLQVYFISLLQLIIASEMTVSVLFGLLYLVFLVMLVAAMVYSHFLREGAGGRMHLGRPIMLISLVTLVITALFFVSIPRLTQRFIGKSHLRSIRTVGFSEQVSFGAFGPAKINPAIVMRIEMDRRLPGPYYWRGMTLDLFDGRTWQDSLKSRLPVVKSADEFMIRPYDRKDVVAQTVYLEPLDSGVIFGLPFIAAVRSDAVRLAADAAGALYMPGKQSRRVTYTAFSSSGAIRASGDLSPYMQLPSGMERISELAKGITAGFQTDVARAAAIESYLKRNYDYSLDIQPPGSGMAAIEDFLFYSKKGFCEYYATSMVLMLRDLGIPARLVTGFAGGEPNAYGNYVIVRQSNAHAWVEAAIGGRWQRYDPTPEAVLVEPQLLMLYLDAVKMKWTRYVVGFSRSDQQEMAKRLFSLPSFLAGWSLPDKIPAQGFNLTPVYFLFAASSAAVLLLILVRLARRPSMLYSAGRYARLKRLLDGKVLTITAATTSSDIRKAAAGIPAGPDIHSFLTFYENERFGGKTLSTRERKEMDRLLKIIRLAIRRSAGSRN